MPGALGGFLASGVYLRAACSCSAFLCGGVPGLRCSGAVGIVGAVFTVPLVVGNTGMAWTPRGPLLREKARRLPGLLVLSVTLYLFTIRFSRSAGRARRRRGATPPRLGR